MTRIVGWPCLFGAAFLFGVVGCVAVETDTNQPDLTAELPKPPPQGPSPDCTLPRILQELDGTCFWYRCEHGDLPHLAAKPVGWDCAYRKDINVPEWTSGVCAQDGVCAPLQ